MKRGSERGRPPFRAMAITGDVQGLADILKFGAEYPRLMMAVMLRDPAHRPVEVRMLARQAMDLGVPDNITLISNSCSVDGINWRHLTAGELRSGEARDGLCGCSVHSAEELSLAEQRGMRYVLYSPIFATSSKPAAVPIGTENLKVFCAGTPLPVFALGGIVTVEQVRICLDAGAFGVAGISLFTRNGQEVLREIASLFAGNRV